MGATEFSIDSPLAVKHIDRKLRREEVPYKVVGNKVYHKKGGNWKVKQSCSSKENAYAAMRLLRGIKHGWVPTKSR